MKVVYFAEDGTQFDNEYECKNYEKRNKVFCVDYPIVADDRGEIIDLKAILADPTNTDNVIVQVLNDIYYIYVTENAYEIYENLRSLMWDWDYGFDMPSAEDVITDAGIALYYEDDNHEGWKSYYDLEDKFYKMEQQFNMMF